MAFQYENDFRHGLGVAVAPADLTITLDADYSAVLPVASVANPVAFKLVNGATKEIVHCTSIIGAVLGGLTRAAERIDGVQTAGTFAVAGTTVSQVETAAALNSFLVDSNNLSDVSSATTARTNLGVGTGDSPQFAGVNVGHASDTTITRVSAGVIAVEGVQIATGTGTASGTNTGDQTITNSSDATSHTVTLSASGGSVQLVEGSGITLTTTGTASNGIVTIASSGGGPGGSSGQFQYNNAGAFAGTSYLVFGTTYVRAFNFEATGLGSSSTQVGELASASATTSTALGYNAACSGVAGVAVGRDTSVTNDSSVALGQGSSSSHLRAVAIGYNAATTADEMMKLGGSTMKWIVQRAHTAAPADATLSAGTVSMWLDEGSNLLTFKVKYSDGTTIKTGTVALA